MPSLAISFYMKIHNCNEWFTVNYLRLFSLLLKVFIYQAGPLKLHLHVSITKLIVIKLILIV